MADIKYGPQYGITYRHVYAGTCPKGPSYIIKSDTKRRNGIVACPGCHGELHEMRVTFAIVPWRRDGRYSLDQAVATYSRESMANADASRRYAACERSPYVVRTLTKLSID